MAAERRGARLIIVGEGDERVFELQEKVTTIGRASDNAIELDDLNSSRHHCQIVRTDGKYELIDLKSRNGTLVNGVLVLRKYLAPGDCVEIGRTKIYFERISAAKAPGTETLRLGTSYFLDPLSDLDEPSQLQALKQERQVFLKILEITRDLNSRRVLSDLLDRILDTVIEVTGAERGFVLLSEGGAVKVRASRNIERQRIEGKTSKISLSIARRVLESGEAVLVEDARLDDTFRQYESVSRLDLVSVLCVPLRVREEIIGTVYVDNRLEAGVFGEHHLRLVEVFASQAAVAIDNARLFEENRRREAEIEEARAELERVNRELENKVIRQSQQLEETLRLLPERLPANLKYSYDAIVTRSPAMFAIFEVLDKVTDSDVPVLIQGESGTGKELVARAIHFNGPRASKRFLSENCAAVPANLLESEFFGHVRGSFTGATRDKPGLFELADGGTLFLDEVVDMSPAMQTKLLRVLENGELRRVGGKETIRVNVRIVSASNRDLQVLVAKGQFREDLFYRLNVITVTLPPLRERKEDIPILIDFFLDRVASRAGTKPLALDSDAFRLLYNYDWPGNVRELENEIERLAALAQDRITPEILSESILEAGKKTRVIWRGRTLREAVVRAQESIEREIIQETLEELGWKKTHTAKVLGISRPTLDSKIDKYGLRREPTKEETKSGPES